MSIYPIHTDKAPKAIGPYSQAISANGFLFISGQLPINPNSGEIEAKSGAEQARVVLEHIRSILGSEGLKMSHVVKMEVFLDNLDDFVEMNQVYAEFFNEGHKPARYAFEVAKLPKGAKIEMACTAAYPSKASKE